MLLQVVALAGDVGGDLDAVHEAHTGDLTQGRVRLFRGSGEHTGAHAALLRVVLQGSILGLGMLLDAALTDELVDGRQSFLLRTYLRACFPYSRARQHPPPWIDARV